jgi:hypothetical protein
MSLARRSLLQTVTAKAALGALPAPPRLRLPSGVISGAIRWDAWYANTDVAREAQNALGYKPWQSRAPWFAKIDGPDHLTAIGTQADIDLECRFAADMGLKYWAFDMFAPKSSMSVAWHLYQSSPNRHLINWCAIVTPAAFGNDPFRNTDVWQANDEIFVNWFGQKAYQTVLGNRPLVYVFWSPSDIGKYFGGETGNFARSLDYLRARCRAMQLGNPYIVIMAGAAASSAEILRDVGADAISNYIPDGGAKPVGATPWDVLDQRTQAFWQSLADQGVACIPIATTGWDTRARREHPESWTHETPVADPKDYFVLPTPSQLQAHLTAAVGFVRNHSTQCPADALLIYSWDECDEGGNPLMPTLGQVPEPR